jgi:hypothetical protein
VAGERAVEYPIWGQYVQPLENNKYSIIAFGATRDPWRTMLSGLLQSKARVGKGADGLLPSQKNWRVQAYDADGILGGQRGFNFLTRNGKLVNQPRSKGRQGGLCMTGFYSGTQQTFSLNFTLEKKGSELSLAPVWMSDTHGQVLALTLDGENWAWESHTTLLDYRSGAVKPDQLMGKVTLEEGKPYQVQVTRAAEKVTWRLMRDGKSEPLAQGEALLPHNEPMRYGVGVAGDEDTAVEFGKVSQQQVNDVWLRHIIILTHEPDL